VIDSAAMTIARRLAILSLLWLPGCASAPSASADAEVGAALESFYSAMKTGDTAAAMAQIAPDAVFVESGRLETRAQYEKDHLPADIGFEKQVTGKRGPLQVTVNGDTAWVIASTDFVGTFDGSPVDFISTQLAVLTRQDGRWLIRSIHWSSRRR
jgi:ketosteroid isomerase-like protein